MAPAPFLAVHCCAPAGLRVATAAEAAAARDAVVLATPFGATAALVASLGDALGGKLIVDITNPFGAVPAGMAGIEVHRRALGRPARWAAAFKTNFAATIGLPLEPRRQCLVAAEDAEVFGTVARLAREAGYDAVDCGGLDAAAALDLMVPLMIDLDRRAGGGRGLSAWRFVPGVGG